MGQHLHKRLLQDLIFIVERLVKANGLKVEPRSLDHYIQEGLDNLFANNVHIDGTCKPDRGNYVTAFQ
jgi:hypothetical protein